MSKRSCSFRLANPLMVGTLRQERSGVKQHRFPVEIYVQRWPGALRSWGHSPLTS